MSNRHRSFVTVPAMAVAVVTFAAGTALAQTAGVGIGTREEQLRNPPPIGDYRRAPGSLSGWERIDSPRAPAVSPPLPTPVPQAPDGNRGPLFDSRRDIRPSPLSSNEFRSTVYSDERTARPDRVEKLADIAPHFSACADWPERGERTRAITVRMSFGRDGQLLGTPRVTAVSPALTGEPRRRFEENVVGAIRGCAPLPLGRNFGAAVAGRPITIRFITGPRPERG